MNINDIRNCANFFKENYLQTFYIITTFNDNSFILIGEKGNFPHLMGIPKNIYNSNGYRNPKKLYSDIVDNQPINNRIIPRNISTTSRMYKKAINFCSSTSIFWNNLGPLAINYNETLNPTSRLSSVDILLEDINLGYMLGWVENNDIPLSGEISIKKYCISSWIDESSGSQTLKEKYMLNQDIDLIKSILAFDKSSMLKKQKTYTYNKNQKISILKSIERNSSNLLINKRNERYYISTARDQGIHCKINGVQY